MIVFSSVTKQFLPDTYALKDVSFEISPGELVLLTGPSGSGKTTLMRLLTKEYAPTSGEILFHNVNLNDIQNSQIHQHRRKIGVVFQDYKLIPELNVWENIALPLSIIGKSEAEIEERVTDLLELVFLADKALHFPKQLSGGEAQRISIARALSTAPAIIFADEPTGNLDKDNSLQIAKLLTKINELGTTIVFATHDHDVLDILNGERHIILEQGQLKSDSANKTKKSHTEEKKAAENEHSDKKSEKKPEQHTETLEKSKTENQKNTKTEEKKGFFSKLFSKPQNTAHSLETTEQGAGDNSEMDTLTEKSAIEESPTDKSTISETESSKANSQESKKKEKSDKSKSKKKS